MIIDEGHRAKNTATKLRKALKQFKVTNSKIILTGTPVQNNLNEFFSIIDLDVSYKIICWDQKLNSNEIMLNQFKKECKKMQSTDKKILRKLFAKI
jgi:SNF2 family DNA or RNA helicase